MTDNRVNSYNLLFICQSESVNGKEENKKPCTKLKLMALFIQRKILAWISGNFHWRMEQHFPEFTHTSTISQRCIQIFRNFITGNCHSNLIFLPVFFGWMVRFAKINNFQIIWKISQEISIPFFPISKFWKFKVEWKTLLVLQIPYCGRLFKITSLLNEI